MLPEVGLLAIIMALILALFQGGWLLTSSRGGSSLNLPYLAVGHWLFLAMGFVALMLSFLFNDFSVNYIAENSNRYLPWYYRLAATWGGHDGSMLLWIFMLGTWGMAFLTFAKSVPLIWRCRTVAILALVNVCMLFFMLFTSNPFQRSLPLFPSNGMDLNPLLQDPGLVIHPPILYAGYVGSGVAFAMAIALLLYPDKGLPWARWLRPWVTSAWCFLTLGILLGSWWAYHVLGWGGYWFWDPVENVSLLPWLAATALLHCLIVCDKRQTFYSFGLFLALVTFLLSLLGTFLVRSGMLVSVHAFANDPKRGAVLLALLGVVSGIALLIYSIRGIHWQSHSPFAFLSRETALLANNILLLLGSLVLLVGILYPMIMMIIGHGEVTVGPAYYNQVFLPLLAPFLLFMLLAPSLSWKNAQLIWKSASLYFLIAAGLTFFISRHNNSDVLTIMGVLLSLWLLFCVLHLLVKTHTRQLPMLISHMGIAVVIFSVAFNSMSSIEKDVALKPGENVVVGQYHFTFEKLVPVDASNYRGMKAQIKVTENKGAKIWRLEPQVQRFIANGMLKSEPSINDNLWQDFYVTLGENLGNDAWSMRIYIKPMMNGLWLGGLLVALGGLLALFRRREPELQRSTS